MPIMITNSRVISIIPAQLTEAIEDRGMTMSLLATKIEVSPKMISKYESGQSEPGANTLRLISKSLNLPLAYFFRKNQQKESVVFFRSQAAARVSSKKIHYTRLKW